MSTETLDGPAVLVRPAVRQAVGRRLRERGIHRGVGKIVSAAAGVALVAMIWSAIRAAGVFPPVLFPGLADVGRAGLAMWRDGTLTADIGTSLTRVVRGFAVGSLAAVAVGTLTATTAFGRLVMQPVLRLFAPIPTVALVPLAILWFGLGEQSKQFVIALGVFVPVWINTHSGLSTTPADYLKVARCTGASRTATLTRIVLPEALPDIVTGLRVGVATAFVLIVVAEMTGTTSGLGYRIAQAQLFSQVDRMLFCLAILGLVGVLCDQIVATVAAPWIRWAQVQR